MTDQTKTQTKLELQLQLQEDWGASEIDDLPSLHESQPEQNYSPGNAHDCLTPPASPKPQVTGQTHLKAIHQCNMEMIADNLFGRIIKKAPGQRPCRVQEYGMQEYFKNPITGWKVYYSALFFEDEGCQPVDYIEQIKGAVLKLSDGKLKLQIEIVHKCKITVTLQYV